MTDDVFYTSTELAKLLKITQRTVYRLMERGVLPYYEIGRVKRFRKKEVEEYLQRVRRPG
jgi:putative molybdopterin biosynthesis protein